MRLAAGEEGATRLCERTGRLERLDDRRLRDNRLGPAAAAAAAAARGSRGRCRCGRRSCGRRSCGGWGAAAALLVDRLHCREEQHLAYRLWREGRGGVRQRRHPKKPCPKEPCHAGLAVGGSEVEVEGGSEVEGGDASTWLSVKNIVSRSIPGGWGWRTACR